MMASRPLTWASFVKLEHTFFSLPVLFGGAVLAARGMPDPWVLVWIALAGTGGRTMAMALNRLIDRRIDASNPRTATRELPAGKMSVGEAWGVAAAGAALYVAACLQLPPICLRLAPIPVAVFLLYPYLKRFTPLAHYGVGLALALAPVGAWVAVRGTLEGLEPALLLSGFTWFWVAGFDIIYATLDERFDREHGIFSLPGRLGSEVALRISAATHLLAIGCLVVLYARFLSGSLTAVLLVAVAVVLFAEQRLASRVDLAFFQLNLVVGFLTLAFVVAGVAGI
jgi:4-hydroxybenzoate polyprenyltransferase